MRSTLLLAEMRDVIANQPIDVAGEPLGVRALQK